MDKPPEAGMATGRAVAASGSGTFATTIGANVPQPPRDSQIGLRARDPATPRPRDPATPRPRDPATPRPRDMDADQAGLGKNPATVVPASLNAGMR